MSDTTQVDAISTTTTTQLDPDLDGLGDKGKETIRKERDARRIAEDAKATAEKELTELRKAQAKRDEADRKAKEDKAKEDGEWERLATEREATVTTLTTERDDYKAKYDTALHTITPGVEAGWKDLPSEVKKLYRGAEDDILAKHAFIADTADLVKTLTGQSPTGPRAPLTPQPVGPAGMPSIEQTRRELAAARGVRR